MEEDEAVVESGVAFERTTPAPSVTEEVSVEDNVVAVPNVTPLESVLEDVSEAVIVFPEEVVIEPTSVS